MHHVLLLPSSTSLSLSLARGSALTSRSCSFVSRWQSGGSSNSDKTAFRIDVGSRRHQPRCWNNTWEENSPVGPVSAGEGLCPHRLRSCRERRVCCWDCRIVLCCCCWSCEGIHHNNTSIQCWVLLSSTFRGEKFPSPSTTSSNSSWKLRNHHLNLPVN